MQRAGAFAGRRAVGHRPRHSRGFTLLEAIVAMVLVASVGLALFSLINGSIFALTRINEVNAQTEATANVLEYMQAVNPMLARQGRAELGGYLVSWQSQPATDVVDRLEGLYQFGLYNTLVVVAQPDGQRWFELNLRQIGYRKVRLAPEEG